MRGPRDSRTQDGGRGPRSDRLRECQTIQRENALRQGTQTHGVQLAGTPRRARWESEALVERDSAGCGRWREQQQSSDRRGSRRRPSTAELGGNLLRCGDGPSDAHGPAAVGANGDLDAEDAGEERHPGQARRGSIAELSVQQGGDGGELELRSPAGEKGGIRGETALRQGTAAAPSATRRHAETSAVRSDALVERDSGGCGRSREQQELSDRSDSRRRPSTAELCGNLLRCGDRPGDAHGPGAAGAHGFSMPACSRSGASAIRSD